MEEAKQRIIENIKYSVEDPDLLKKISNIVGMVLDDYDIDRKGHIVICDNDQVNKDITDYIGQKRVEGKSEGTLELYTLYIRELYGYTKKNLRYISKDDIIGYFAYLESKGLSKCTIDSHRRVLNAFFRKMSDNGIILKSPMAMIGRIKYQEAERKPLTGREIAIVKRSCISERETAIFDILVSSGIRVAELVDLNRSDVDMHTGRIIIAHGKEDKRRSVYIDDEALVSISYYLRSREDTNPALFVSARLPHERLQKRGVEMAIHNLGIRSGLDSALFPHRLRHTFASRFLRRSNGQNTTSLMHLMGHEKYQTTLIYAKLGDDQLEHDYRTFSA